MYHLLFSRNVRTTGNPRWGRREGGVRGAGVVANWHRRWSRGQEVLLAEEREIGQRMDQGEETTKWKFNHVGHFPVYPHFETML